MTDHRIRSELAPSGALRAAINLSNGLLVTGRSAEGDPTGVAPDLARELADRIGVPVRYVNYPRPGELADAAGSGAWDIGLIGAEPKRAEKIFFTPAYAEIEATYMVPAASGLGTIADVDAPGIRIAVGRGTAYALWLERNIARAELMQFPSTDASVAALTSGKADALAALRTRLLADARTMPEMHILDGHFATVQQAIGTARANTRAAGFLRDFVEEAKRSGLIARLIARHAVEGLSVAAAAEGKS